MQRRWKAKDLTDKAARATITAVAELEIPGFLWQLEYLYDTDERSEQFTERIHEAMIEAASEVYGIKGVTGAALIDDFGKTRMVATNNQLLATRRTEKHRPDAQGTHRTERHRLNTQSIYTGLPTDIAAAWSEELHSAYAGFAKAEEDRMLAIERMQAGSFFLTLNDTTTTAANEQERQEKESVLSQVREAVSSEVDLKYKYVSPI